MRHVYLIKSLYVFLLNVTHIKKPHPACRVKFAQLLKICLSLTDIILMNQQLKKCREHSAYKYMLKLRINLQDFNAVLSHNLDKVMCRLHLNLRHLMHHILIPRTLRTHEYESKLILIGIHVINHLL